MQKRVHAQSGAGHGCFQALTIHLHLIKFSLLLPGTSAVTAPTLIKKTRIFCSSRLECHCPSAARAARVRHTTEALDAREGSSCLQPGVSNASFYGVGDFRVILVSSVTLQAATKSSPSGLCPSSCPRTGQRSQMSPLFSLSAELKKTSPGASQ